MFDTYAWKGPYTDEEWRRIDREYKNGTHWTLVVVPWVRRHYKDRCAVCGSDYHLEDHNYITVHHVVYYVNGELVYGKEKMWMLRLLCKECHKRGKYTIEEIRRDRRRYLVAKMRFALLYGPPNAILEVLGVETFPLNPRARDRVQRRWGQGA